MIRTLVTHQRYFGLEARALRAGALRALAAISELPFETARLDLRGLGEHFGLDASASMALLQEMLTGGLLEPIGTGGGYRTTERFREYAQARVAAPLSRARAKALIEKACGLAAHINADWVRSPLLINMVAVSGGYMNRGDKLAELTLWLVVHSRPQARSRQRRRSLRKTDGSRQIIAGLRPELVLRGAPCQRQRIGAATVQRRVPGRRRRNDAFPAALGEVPRVGRFDQSASRV
jgi:hypothetical protein